MNKNTAASRAAVIFLSLGFIALAANISNGNISFKKGPDALTSATVKDTGERVTLSGVSGNYTVIVNKDRVPESILGYFSGREKRPVAEIVCHIPKGDQKAREFALQMTDKAVEEDPMLLLSKAEYGEFDILILSKKTADKYTAKSLYDKEFTAVLEITGE
ncbi:MAG: hypothetical protein IKS17_05525 [Firmicutes bacterium]|nr:hypothetical protein [Bacillota bacterium]